MSALLNLNPSAVANTGIDLRRSKSTTRGNVPAVDGYITSELEGLDQLLSKRIFKRECVQGRAEGTTAERQTATTAKQEAKAAAAGAGAGGLLHTLLIKPLTPRKSPKDHWDDGSLLDTIHKTAEAADNYSLSELVDATAGLAPLKYAFKNDIATKFFALDFASRTVLAGYPAVTDFLVAYAYFVMNLSDTDAARNFIISSPSGVAKIVKYAVVSAARAYLQKARLEVPHLEDDHSEVIKSIADADLSLQADAFTKGVDRVIQAPVFNGAEAMLVDIADKLIGPIPAQMKPTLIRYIQSSNELRIPITKDNVVYYVSGWIQQIARTQQTDDAAAPPTSPDQADSDFDITPFDDDRSQIQISRSAVKCASQLYYGMVLGEELQVFNSMSFFTHKYLVRGSLTIEDSRLRDDLQSYVFSNRFTDPRTNRVLDRTRPAERAMFYRQVFNSGGAQINDEVVLNAEFPRLWKVLMLESAKFLERAQLSPNPDNYVSRQNVLQSVEDLQYNLSTHCTGMANVIAPLINAELEFVVKRIFMHPEVLRQVVPSGGTWWRVVETLVLAMTGGRPKATVIYNKAKGGNDIIRAIADYDPQVFAQDETFGDFIGTVERFITTQSILQDALTDDLVRSGANGDAGAAPSAQGAMGGTPGTPGSPEVAAAAADQEWNF